MTTGTGPGVGPISDGILPAKAGAAFPASRSLPCLSMHAVRLSRLRSHHDSHEQTSTSSECIRLRRPLCIVNLLVVRQRICMSQILPFPLSKYLIYGEGCGPCSLLVKPRPYSKALPQSIRSTAWTVPSLNGPLVLHFVPHSEFQALCVALSDHQSYGFPVYTQSFRPSARPPVRQSLPLSYTPAIQQCLLWCTLPLTLALRLPSLSVHLHYLPLQSQHPTMAIPSYLCFPEHAKVDAGELLP
ncbi:hypothetical protein BC628DRAFT_945338 [Trametes gibbosa]|nr:hypothetical protein BC628DRAFT_945338 [Trametes gibbosa]